MLSEAPGRQSPTISAPEVPLRKLADLAALRLILAGESVVDQPHLFFADRAAVDAFLRSSGFDTDNPLDLGALRKVHHEAGAYLGEQLGYRLPAQIEDIREVQDLFLMA